MLPKQSITRYPGITSFPDTALAYQLFFGREQDSRKLFYFITSESLTLLYSKSGYGKTSLLQARVFKMLREQNYYPVSVRLNKKDRGPKEVIQFEIQNINKEEDYEVIIKNKDGELRHFFSDLEIWSPDDKLLTPVIILDQFEEIFTLEHNFQYRTDFINELSQVLNETKEGHLNVRFVISIREDFLGHLEKLATKIPSIFSNRIRLEALTKQAALEAIVQPAQMEIENVVFDSPKINYLPDASAELVRFLSLKMIEGNWIETNEVEPAQLQIICSELEERAIADKRKNNTDEYTISKNDLGGDEGMRAMLRTFYDKQIKKIAAENNLSNEEITAIRNLIEKELIIANRRVPMAYDAILRKPDIKKDAINSLIDSKLLKVENYQQTILVEISHDALVEPIVKALEKREIEEQKIKEKEELAKAQQILAEEAERLKKKRKKTLILSVSCSFLVGIFLLYSYAQVNRNRNTLRQLKSSAYSLNSQIASLKKTKDSLSSLSDSLQIQYLQSKGFTQTSNPNDLTESIKADSVLKKLLAAQGNQLDTAIIIQYFRRNVDDDKVWIAMKELGYTKTINIASNINSQSNGIFYGANIKLLDLKVIALTLIRAGFKLRRIADIPKPETIQLISRSYRPNESLAAPLTVQEVINATRPTDFNRGYKYD